jgi:mannosyltransferase OCH1-like enzyme
MSVQRAWPDFDISMQFSYKFCNERIELSNWELLKQRYKNLKQQNSSEQLIPKIIHQIWIGREMPENERRMCQAVKDSLDSTWKYILWSEHDINKLSNFKNYQYFIQTPNPGQKSDLLRYAVLSEYGGVYLDTDFIPYKNFDELLNLEFFCGIAYDANPGVFNGLIGSTKNNDIIKDLLILDRSLQHHDGMALMDSTGPFFLTRKLFKNFNSVTNAIALPNSFFYPYPNFDICRKLGNRYQEYLKPETICCHMWSSAWM